MSRLRFFLAFAVKRPCSCFWSFGPFRPQGHWRQFSCPMLLAQTFQLKRGPWCELRYAKLYHCSKQKLGCRAYERTWVYTYYKCQLFLPETKDAAEASEAATAEQQKQHKKLGHDAGPIAGWEGVMTSWVYPGCRPSTRTRGGRVGLVDSASEKNKARAVVEIYRIF